MKSAALTQFLVDITRGPLKAEFGANAKRVVEAAPLDNEIRAAILSHDVAALWLAKAHPMALLYFARAIGWDNDRYYRCVKEAEVRRFDPIARNPAAAPVQR